MEIDLQGQSSSFLPLFLSPHLTKFSFIYSSLGSEVSNEVPSSITSVVLDLETSTICLLPHSFLQRPSKWTLSHQAISYPTNPLAGYGSSTHHATSQTYYTENVEWAT